MPEQNQRTPLPPPQANSVSTKALRRLQQLHQRARTLPADHADHQRYSQELQRAEAEFTRRSQSVPAITVDAALPIAAYGEALIKAISEHQVVIVAGETGSGKTTQIPKLCLAAGRGLFGMIGCTQPRRIAAKTVAKRVSQELACELGTLVGWQVRFTDAAAEQTLIKFMTDGILLAQTQTDRLLNQYDTLIIDEAHERSLNIDFLLGYIKKILPKRRDLKVIITSATIDTARFSAHFGDAPIFTVEGRGFPVDIRYRPILGDEEERNERAQAAAIISVLEELEREHRHELGGDVLVFLPGEREIRDAQTALQRRNFRETEVVTLFARLSASEQEKVFAPGPKRRIVLATNVAETSITVPRIRYVIDTGTARISRYSPRSKIERLHIEAISQASANQRAGRCGRIAPGICIRLYEESDFLSRSAFTDPEILRSALAGVLLRMLKLGLGDPREFPFVEPPDERAINDGYAVLHELGALQMEQGRARQLTELGRQMADLPIDVHYARMLLAAKEEQCLPEMLILAAALSIQDPRERPADQRGTADAAHAQFGDERSDFLSLIRLWEAFTHQSAQLTQSKLRDWARRNFLSFLRLREWRDLHTQLTSYAREQNWLSETHKPASYENLHRAILTALVAQVGEHDEKGIYRGTRQRKFQIFPGSAIKGSPRWVMADTLLDTHKVWAIGVARIEPAWLEKIGAHLLKHRYYDPFWDERAGRVMCYHDASLLGLSIFTRRRAQYEQVNPGETRELFLHHAMAAGEVQASHRLFAHNALIRQEAAAKEDKLRRRGLLQSLSGIAQWFDARIPTSIRSVPALLQWLRSPEGKLQEANLRLHINDLMLHDAPLVREFPDELAVGSLKLPLSYHFDPSAENDGASARVKLEQLGALPLALLDWLVPGLREEKAASLIKSLPKNLRRLAVPAPDFARAFLEACAPSSDLSMSAALAQFLTRVCGERFSESDFDSGQLPKHLQLRIEVIAASGEILAQGRDIAQLQSQFQKAARAAFTERVGAFYNRDHLLHWPFDLPEQVRSEDGSAAYPALHDAGVDASLRAYASESEAVEHHAGGVLRLARLRLVDELRYWRKHISLSATAMLSYTSIGSSESLREDLVESVFLEFATTPAAAVRTSSEFQRLCEAISKHLGPLCTKRAAQVDEILSAASALKRKLKPPVIGMAKANLDDLQAQLDGLIYRKFLLQVQASRLQHYPRYLKAMQIRLERLFLDPSKDQNKMLDLLPFMAHVQQHHSDPNTQALRWLLEEFRVSIFAPELKTAEPVSVKRLRALLPT